MSKDTSPASAQDYGYVALGLLMLVGITAIPAFVGPVMAPRLLPVAGSVLCPEGTTGAHTEIIVSRNRNKTSYSWELRCQQADYTSVRVSGLRAHFGAWVLFNSVVFGALALAAVGYAWIERKLKGARS
jgi:hypothetical protein